MALRKGYISDHEGVSIQELGCRYKAKRKEHNILINEVLPGTGISTGPFETFERGQLDSIKKEVFVSLIANLEHKISEKTSATGQQVSTHPPQTTHATKDEYPFKILWPAIRVVREARGISAQTLVEQYNYLPNFTLENLEKLESGKCRVLSQMTRNVVRSVIKYLGCDNEQQLMDEANTINSRMNTSIKVKDIPANMVHQDKGFIEPLGLTIPELGLAFDQTCRRYNISPYAMLPGSGITLTTLRKFLSGRGSFVNHNRLIPLLLKLDSALKEKGVTTTLMEMLAANKSLAPLANPAIMVYDSYEGVPLSDIGSAYKKVRIFQKKAPQDILPGASVLMQTLERFEYGRLKKITELKLKTLLNKLGFDTVDQFMAAAQLIEVIPPAVATHKQHIQPIKCRKSHGDDSPTHPERITSNTAGVVHRLFSADVSYSDSRGAPPTPTTNDLWKLRFRPSGTDDQKPTAPGRGK